MLDLLFKTRAAAAEAQRNADLRRAEAILSLEDTEGWKAFKKAAEDLAASLIPEVGAFTEAQAVPIASQMAVVSGIKRCLNLMDQHREIYKSLKKPEDN